MTAAAFKATYAEWRVIKTRATVQLVFELPIEQADEAYQALGGMPIAAREVWCAIARLNLVGSSAVEHGAVNASVAGSIPARSSTRAFHELAPAQQAGILCNERAFRLFLAEKFDMPIPDPDEAASVIRHHCKVKSRAEIKSDNGDWSGLVLAYRLWQREPEYVG